MFSLSLRCFCSHAHTLTRGMMITQDARGAAPGLRAQGRDQDDADQDDDDWHFSSPIFTASFRPICRQSMWWGQLWSRCVFRCFTGISAGFSGSWNHEFTVCPFSENGLSRLPQHYVLKGKWLILKRKYDKIGEQSIDHFRGITRERGSAITRKMLGEFFLWSYQHQRLPLLPPKRKYQNLRFWDYQENSHGNWFRPDYRLRDVLVIN